MPNKEEPFVDIIKQKLFYSGRKPESYRTKEPKVSLVEQIISSEEQQNNKRTLFREKSAEVTKRIKADNEISKQEAADAVIRFEQYKKDANKIFAVVDAVISQLKELGFEEECRVKLRDRENKFFYDQDILHSAIISETDLKKITNDQTLDLLKEARRLVGRLEGFLDDRGVEKQSFDEALTNAKIDGVSIFEFAQKQDRKLFDVLCEKNPEVASKFYPEAVKAIMKSKQSDKNPQNSQICIF